MAAHSAATHGPAGLSRHLRQLKQYPGQYPVSGETGAHASAHATYTQIQRLYSTCAQHTTLQGTWTTRLQAARQPGSLEGKYTCNSVTVAPGPPSEVVIRHPPFAPPHTAGGSAAPLEFYIAIARRILIYRLACESSGSGAFPK